MALVRLGKRQGHSQAARRGPRWRWPALGLVLVLASLAAGPAALGSPSLVRVAPAPRLPQGIKAVGAVPATASISGAVVLKPRDNAALQRFVATVSDKSSPQFGHYLPAGQFAGRFGPTQASIDAVRSQLQSDDLHVAGVSSDGLLVQFSGSAAKVQSAFHTGFERYRMANGTEGRQTTSAVSLPSSIAPEVAGVVGLQTLVRPHSQAVRGSASARGQFPKATPAASFPHPAGSPTPCSAAKSAAQSLGGLTDDQIANAYGTFGLYGAGDFGAGQRVAVFELEPFLKSDLQTFDTCYFGATRAGDMIKNVTVVPIDGGQPTGAGSGEAILDVEDISALAPQAGLDVYEAPNTNFGSIDAYAGIINADQDRVISTSWGFCEQAEANNEPGGTQAENFLFEQAAAQGQTIFSAAGDEGSDDCNAFELPNPPAGQPIISADDPTSQPYVVGVGGTTIDNASTQPPQERVWNDGNFWGGGGGGISQSWTMPSWQRAARVPGVVLPGSAPYKNAAKILSQNGFPSTFCAVVAGATTSTPCRLTPDVAAQGDEFTGAVTIFSESFTPFSSSGWITIGGTSSSAPLWAGMLADVNASATCKAQSATADGVGFVSPLLYAVASNSGQYAASFNDITTGNNDIFGLDNGLVYPATKGYDLTTGLGSPKLTGPNGSPGLAFYLCKTGGAVARSVVSNLTPNQGSTAGGEKITVVGSNFGSASSPAVSSVQVGVAQVTGTGFKVTSPTTLTLTMPPGVQTIPPPPGSRSPQSGAGPANVVVTLKNGQSSATSPASTFQYVDTSSKGAIPSITGVSPYGALRSKPGTITLLGSGFTGATRVTFGQVNAPSFTVVSPNRMTVAVPPSSSSTTCVPLPTTGVFKGENASNDICQVQVRVFNANGVSAMGKILPPPEGAIGFNPDGSFAVPPGCKCEIAPSPTEFDYVPAAVVTSISTSNGPASLASENGGSVVTVRGRGLGLQTIDWANFGPPTQADSQNTNYVFLTGTQMQIVTFPQPLTTGILSVPFSVMTVAGLSSQVTSQFAGVPTVTSVSNQNNSKRLNGTSGAVATGGTPIQIQGKGFARQVLAPIEFNDASGSGFSTGTQYKFTASSDTVINTQTVSQNPDLIDVQVCTVTDCSAAGPGDELWLYPPGDPTVDSVMPSSGPAAGGTKTTINGDNLGCVLTATFGTKQATAVSNVPTGILDCGSTSAVRATSPAGTAGTSVPVRVTTVESFFTGSGPSQSTAKFTYASGG